MESVIKSRISGGSITSGALVGTGIGQIVTSSVIDRKKPTASSEGLLRNRYVTTARGYLGVIQGSARHKELVDLYNSLDPLPVKYKVSYNDAWCAVFVTAIAMQLNLLHIIPPECGVARMLELFKEHPSSQWEEKDCYTPALGDIVFFDWGDSGIGDNMGHPDHVGIVCSVRSTSFSAIEGNYDKSVKIREMDIDGRYIRGFGLPNFGTIGNGSIFDKKRPANMEVF